ncbi:PepSY-associated TM helix domain-containing protein [Flavobacterium filum]|uniref:PepSY-associated TM helix domain-containing protein n=2 Tax=Flavobacteriaceae TaxID=49546 RepID=UPI001FE05351|nr:PepSY-associated TM helix domain-containing protein [Flavobacterium filum]
MENYKMTASKRVQQAKIIRIFRKIHRTTGIFLFVFYFIIAITGFLLGIKKHSGGLILPKTQTGSSTKLVDFIALDSLQQIAQKEIALFLKESKPSQIDRIDIRPEKGIVKFTFKSNFYEVQLDGATGSLLQIDLRRSDIIEKIHDGSIIDYYLGFESGFFKLIYTSILSMALLLFVITGFWLWYGPKRMRKGN